MVILGIFFLYVKVRNWTCSKRKRCLCFPHIIWFNCFRAPAQRQIGETALNETSSRSHQILRLVIVPLILYAPHWYYIMSIDNTFSLELIENCKVLTTSTIWSSCIHVSITKLCLRFQCRGMAERKALEPVHQKSEDRRVWGPQEQMPVLSIRHPSGMVVFWGPATDSECTPYSQVWNIASRSNLGQLEHLSRELKQKLMM